MRSSRLLALACGVALALVAPRVHAQPKPAEGFATERFVPSAPGAGWFVMDDLNLHGGLGGVAGISFGYAHDPLRVTGDNGTRFPLVRDQGFADFGFAITYSRFRLYLDLNMPLAVSGRGGEAAGYQFTSPSVDLGSQPDTLVDTRIGFDARLYGEPGSALRLGAGAQLIVPSGKESDYLSDGTYRAMLRALAAGDVRHLTYAGYLGVHIRPLSDTDLRESPQGSELLFGAAGGARLPLGARPWQAVIGPEFWGETAFQSFFGKQTTGFEGILGARLEGTKQQGAQIRFRAGAGGGLNDHFGAPEWRLVFGIEVFNRNEK